MRSGRIIALLAVLVWFYVLLASIVNPSYTTPTIPTNPVMPFFTADVVALFWPLVLLSSPLMILAAQRLIHTAERTRRVSTRELARVQARAHATKERIREDIRQSGSRSSRTAQAGTAPTEAEPISETSDEKKLLAVEELLRPVPKTEETEFTPPPTTERTKRSQETQTEASNEGETEQESFSDELETLSEEEKAADSTKRIDELEAERAAMASLMDRLEDMQKKGAIQPELYDKLKKKYVSELERINAKVERLPVNEEFKKKAQKK